MGNFMSVNWEKEYSVKNLMLTEKFGQQVSPNDFYRDLFPKDLISKKFCKSDASTRDGLGCPILNFVPELREYNLEKKKLYNLRHGGIKVPVTVNEDNLDPDILAFFKEFGATAIEIKRIDEDTYRLRLDNLDRFYGLGNWTNHAAWGNKGDWVHRKYRKKGTNTIEITHWSRCLHNDYYELAYGLGHRVCYLAPMSYYGSKNTVERVSSLFAIVLDLDLVDQVCLKNLLDFFDRADAQRSTRSDKAFTLLTPTYIINSGTGLHLYYLLNEPLKLFPHITELNDLITELKTKLIQNIWSKYTSLKPEIDSQNAFQDYRMVGSLSKRAGNRVITAFKASDKRYSIEDLNNSLGLALRLKMPLESHFPEKKKLDYCKEHFPHWYNRTILGLPDTESDNKKPPADTTVKHKSKHKSKHKNNNNVHYRYLKESDKLLERNHVGCRYYRCALMFADAYLGGYSYDECYQYLISKLPDFNLAIPKAEWLTEADIVSAGAFYTSAKRFWRLATINRLCDYDLKPVRRNGRPMFSTYDDDGKVIVLGHMDYLNQSMKMGHFKNTHFTSETASEAGKKGTKDEIIRAYMLEHPNARKVDVIRETGLSKPTVYKYYDKIKEEIANANGDKGNENGI